MRLLDDEWVGGEAQPQRDELAHRELGSKGACWAFYDYSRQLHGKLVLHAALRESAEDAPLP